MAMKSILNVLLLMIVGVQCGNVIFEDCGSSYDLEIVRIAGCERTGPCILFIGEPTNVTAIFKASYTSNSLTQKVYVLLNSVQTDPYVAPSACEATWCPVKVQSSAVYSATLELPTNIALNARGNLFWNVFNEKGTRVICFSVLIQTRSSLLNTTEILNY